MHTLCPVNHLIKTTPKSTLGLHFVSFKLQHQLLRNLKFYQLHFIWPPLYVIKVSMSCYNEHVHLLYSRLPHGPSCASCDEISAAGNGGSLSLLRLFFKKPQARACNKYSAHPRFILIKRQLHKLVTSSCKSTFRIFLSK